MTSPMPTATAVPGAHVHAVYRNGDLIGTVWRARDTWYARILGEKASSEHRTRREAEQRLDNCLAMRAAAANLAAANASYRETAPAGWRYVNWTDIADQGITVVRRPIRTAFISGVGGPRYPLRFAPAQQIHRLVFLGNGCVVAYFRGDGDAVDVALLTSRDAHIGALVPYPHAAT